MAILGLRNSSNCRHSCSPERDIPAQHFAGSIYYVSAMEVSNPDRVMFPATGHTKADVVAHYEHVGERLLRFAAGRPLTLQRFPKGVAAKGFMQKNAAAHFPESIGRYPVSKRDGDTTEYPVVTQPEDLAYLANQGTITFHMWTSTVSRPHHPDWMILDLDPEADDLEGVRFATGVLRGLLSEFGIEGFPLATGSKGFHIWVPLTGEQEFGEISQATRALAGLAAHLHGDELTIEFLKKERKGRVFVDWLRNTGIATVVAPFSLRPRPSAPIAVPLRWGELASARPDRWTLDALEDRFEVDTDLPAQQVPVEAILKRARSAGVDLDTPHDRFGRRRKG